MPAQPANHLIAHVAVGLLVCGLAVPTAVADPADPATTAPPTESRPAISPWLEEVRAQRRAWEARRRDSQEAAQARRQWSDPRAAAAAQQEAWDEMVQRRRDDWLEEIDRDRRYFRQQGPWQWGAGDRSSAAASDLRWQQVEQLPATDRSSPSTFPPSGWNNGWYYNGY
jgi:hypothetical protein